MDTSSVGKEHASNNVQKSSEIHIEECGTQFINGTYVRTEINVFTKRTVLPYSNQLVTLEIRKHCELHPLSIPGSLCLSSDDEIFVISSTNPCIHYFVCIVSLSPMDNEYQSHWYAVAGLDPLPLLRPISDLKTYFDAPMLDDEEHLKKIVVTNTEGMDKKQLVKSSGIHKHFVRWTLPIKSSWIELERGLKGGQCLKVEMDRNTKIWNILLEISSMNAISPWNVRLQHLDSGLYVHYLWHYTLSQCIALIDCRSATQQVLSNKFAYFVAEHFVAFYSHFDDTQSFQSRYLQCNDNVDVLANTIRKHEAYLEEIDRFTSQQNEDEDDVKEEEPVMDIGMESAVDPDRDTHVFRAERVWDKRTLTVYFGDKSHCVLLEDCSPGCECWTDDIGGCRIGYVVEYLLHIPLEEQGWIAGAKMIDYFDENAADFIFQNDFKLIVYRKL